MSGQLNAPEQCFYFDIPGEISARAFTILSTLLEEPQHRVAAIPLTKTSEVVEIGPRLSIETPFSSNAVAICQALDIPVSRVEMSTRYPVEGFDQYALIERYLDPMTQEIYKAPLSSFDSGKLSDPVVILEVLKYGIDALKEANKLYGLGMDTWDIEFYVNLFQRINRNPTDIELFQLGNANSEHSRHHYWRGIQVIDGVEMSESLMQIVQAPWKANPRNSLVAFHDNAGVIRGRRALVLAPTRPGEPSPFRIIPLLQHITATAETHNHPTGISPLSGAATGILGEKRDEEAAGRGGIARGGNVAGYAVGNLHLKDAPIPGETVGGEETRRHASPIKVLIEGSDGVSRSANELGVPLLGGWCRSLGLSVDGARREFRKPVLYVGGINRIDHRHVKKHAPEKGMLIVRFGGPAYPIGVGGGAASSMAAGANTENLDLKSVQRGNAEYENRVNRVIQACAEMGDKNPIEAIHDQGAGGPSNVLTELMEPAGGCVDIRKITLGDKTMSLLEIWVAEYQESYGALVRQENIRTFQGLCEREGVNCEVLGEITGDGNVVVHDSKTGTNVVDLSLTDILTDIPRKRFSSTRKQKKLPPLEIPSDLSVGEALEKVFRQLSVGSKGFLTRKIDRSVTGIVAQQPCVGPFNLPLADVGVTADSFFGFTGAAEALGENPNRLLINPKAGARMAVAEMLTNMAAVVITRLEDIKCRANWMWAAKLPHEGAELYDAAVSLRDIMIPLGFAIDGGKDSLSMSTYVGEELAISPGQLVIFGYASVPDIRKIITPDFKGGGRVGYIDLGKGRRRLGGSALAQALGQLGNECPDIDDQTVLARAFNGMQRLIKGNVITAYHDVSDGGLLTAFAEMCIAGNRGAGLHSSALNPVQHLFAEEAGILFEFRPSAQREIDRVLLDRFGLRFEIIGETDTKEGGFLNIEGREEALFAERISSLRCMWEATSSALELRQANPETVRQEQESFLNTKSPRYRLPRNMPTKFSKLRSKRPKVAVLRCEGTNGEREMAAAAIHSGLEPVDVAMSDIRRGIVTSFEEFQGVAFPGGFSYADVFGSAKGFAAQILYNPRIQRMYADFYERKDTTSLGVCNGCQLMHHIGWVPEPLLAVDGTQPKLVRNLSGRFESRWATVKILPSPSIHLTGMAGAVLGIHVAHGEGRFYFPNPRMQEWVEERHLAPIRYVDPDGNLTIDYPYNPNGSPGGIAALCSSDGRHLAMMPHPERCFLPWQWQWKPEKWRDLKVSPWRMIFDNMRTWCLDQ